MVEIKPRPREVKNPGYASNGTTTYPTTDTRPLHEKEVSDVIRRSELGLTGGKGPWYRRPVAIATAAAGSLAIGAAALASIFSYGADKAEAKYDNPNNYEPVNPKTLVLDQAVNSGAIAGGRINLGDFEYTVKRQDNASMSVNDNPTGPDGPDSSGIGISGGNINFPGGGIPVVPFDPVGEETPTETPVPAAQDLIIEDNTPEPATSTPVNNDTGEVILRIEDLTPMPGNTPYPTGTPTPSPTPYSSPTAEPTPKPKTPTPPVPTTEPTVEPTPEPTEEPTSTPTVEPTPEAEEEVGYTPQGPYVEDVERGIIIEYKSEVGKDAMQKDLSTTQKIYDGLAKLYGGYPDKSIIFQQQDNGEMIITTADTLYPFTIDFSLDKYNLSANEISHGFTRTRIPTDQIWWEEAVSNFSQGFVGRGTPENYDYSLSGWDELYEKIVEGELKFEGTMLDAHKGTLLLGKAAADLGLDNDAMGRILMRQYKIAQEKGIVGFEDIKNTLVEELGEDILEVLETIKPITDYNGYWGRP